MKIRIIDRLGVFLIGLMDIVQEGLLKSYVIFAFIASRAPQKFGAQACCYRAFKEFLTAYRKVPAYKKFLEKSDWSCESTNSDEIFKSLPITDKPNYVLPYTTEERCLNGNFFHKGVVIDESSGSTGIPYNWVRGRREREIVKDLIGVYLRYCYGDKKYIVLNTFSMGAWATGFNMALAAQALGVVKSTGPDVEKILHTLRFFGNKYPYILNGYPPFLKYLFDEGEKAGFNWHDYDIHALVGGEGMSEGLRDYLLRNAKTVYSGYGASDLEIGMGGENPLTVMIRKICLKDAAIRKTLFGEDQRLPMLFQYNPIDHFVEIIDREIVVTISKPWTLSPRIRYNIKDEGGMITFDEMQEKLRVHGVNIKDLEKKCNYPRWYVPFLFVYGRKDSTVSVMGANIYPEDVESIVYSDLLLASSINSFSISLEEDAQGNPRPCFEFELLKGAQKAEVEETLSHLLSSGLAKLSLDYKKAKDEYPQAVEPIIRIFGMHEGPFKDDCIRIKKRYVKKA
ncbi:MAG TPA: phenylacetate--CoA ligase family protein [Candidatus Omnitrophota bacterium]|nr:phenylacetate--CoA ligase family protein [Candidatus Omnitrophota bacterium]HPS20513.1 phenylacetate--CoA ligase family protein [Candidatus Omnitrophota bacterium]